MTNIRHWDMALIGITKLPKWLKQTKSNIIMKGNEWNNHSFNTGKLYITTPVEKLEEGKFVFGYLVAKSTTLLHPDHWVDNGTNTRTMKIPDGIYELRKQVEYTNEWLKPVID